MSKIPDYYYSEEWRQLRRIVLHRDNHTCQYCGRPAEQADHVIPRKQGGKDHVSNLVACCVECNKLAGGRLFRNFKSKKAYILQNRKPARKKKSKILRIFGGE